MSPPIDEPPAHARTLTRKEWSLVALGLVAWVGIGTGGAWLVHQLARTPESCGAPVDTPTTQARAATPSPRNAFQLLTGTGRCK